MARETDQEEFDLLDKRAKALGYHLQRHKVFDPCMPYGGDLYIQRRKAIYEFEGGTGDPPSLLRYASAEQIHQFLFERESEK